MDLRQYAETPIQIATINAIENNNGNLTHAAREMKINLRTLQRTVDRIKRNKKRHLSASNGYAPELGLVKPASAGIGFIGASVLSKNTDPDSDVALVWNKYKVDNVRQFEDLKDTLLDVFNEYKGKSPIKGLSNPKKVLSDILTVYPMGDPHIGMYAWAEECGEDFDCDIARDNLTKAVQNLVERSPATHTAVILNLGDFFHGDNYGNTTTKGTDVDVDTRWARVLKIGVETMIQCVYSALEKHKKVIVKNVCGNHDSHTSQMLAIAMSCYFSNNKRVEIDISPSHFWYYQFGKVLLGSTHGDMAKPDSLGQIMATDKAEAWGSTKYRYWLTGHIHSQNVKEYPGCVWESFRTLASKDAWHSAMGYRSGRDMNAIIYHKEHGEIERHKLSITMLG